MDKLVIFDLNGVLVRTGKAYLLAYQEALAKYDIELPKEEFFDFRVRRGKDLKWWLEVKGYEQQVKIEDQIRADKESIFQANIGDRVELMPNVVATLRNLNSSFLLSLESSSEHGSVQAMLDFFGLTSYFKGICTIDTNLGSKYGMNHGKGTRIKYLAEKLECELKNVVFIGDAEKDIAAAKGLGVKLVAIPNETTVNNDFKGADLVLSSLAQLSRDVLLKLLDM